MFDAALNIDCKTMAEVFEISGKDGWGSENFAKQLFNTEWGVKILKGISVLEYACPMFMYEGLLREMHKRKGKVYSQDVLWYSGYFYRYVMDNCHDKPNKVYEKAPIKVIAERFPFYHTQDYEYVKNDLGVT